MLVFGGVLYIFHQSANGYMVIKLDWEYNPSKPVFFNKNVLVSKRWHLDIPMPETIDVLDSLQHSNQSDWDTLSSV